MRRAARRDECEPAIMDALKAAGWGVYQVDGTGFPDLVVAKGTRTLLMEVIGDAKAAKYRKTGGLTPAQVRFHSDWPGIIYCVRTPEDALAFVSQKERT